MTVIDAPAPRRSELLARWRVDIRWRAYGVISYQADGCIGNGDLAAAVGVEPRSLHATLSADPHFVCDIRWNAKLRRGEPWWRINADLKAPPRPELPRLVRVAKAQRLPHKLT